MKKKINDLAACQAIKLAFLGIFARLSYLIKSALLRLTERYMKLLRVGQFKRFAKSGIQSNLTILAVTSAQFTIKAKARKV